MADRRFSSRQEQTGAGGPPAALPGWGCFLRLSKEMLSSRWRRQAKVWIMASLTEAPLGYVGDGERSRVKLRQATLNKKDELYSRDIQG